MSPVGFLQYLHAADPTDTPADGDIPVFSVAGNGYVPTAPTLATTDYVVMSDGANPPNPMDDGAGNFLYVPYTP